MQGYTHQSPQQKWFHVQKKIGDWKCHTQSITFLWLRLKMAFMLCQKAVLRSSFLAFPTSKFQSLPPWKLCLYTIPLFFNGELVLAWNRKLYSNKLADILIFMKNREQQFDDVKAITYSADFPDCWGVNYRDSRSRRIFRERTQSILR